MNENKPYLTEQIITYIGNKRKLLQHIENIVLEIKKTEGKDKLVCFDGFSGSGVVARMLKQHSSKLIVNDLEEYSFIINKCYLENKNNVDYNKLQNYISDLKQYIEEYNKIGNVQKLYSPKNDKDIKIGERCFYTNENAKVLDAVIDYIHLHNKIEDFYKPFILAPILSEASIHVNTSGIFKGFYKNKQGIGQFGGEGRNALERIMGKIQINFPVFSNFDSELKIYKKDTNFLIKEELRNEDIDVTYFDYPYNQHPYASNYFLLNNIVSNNFDENIISKISGIPKNWNKSKYNYKSQCYEQIEYTIINTNSKYIIISYNNEGFVKYDEFVEMLSKYGELKINTIKYNTFKGSRNLKNRSNKVNEFLFVLEEK